MGDCSKSSNFPNLENTSDVIIIGAGMAGLAAANHLLKNGIHDIKILEARKRIGGRILSIPLMNHKVELGANWIHGVLDNPIFELAMTNKLVNIINVPKPAKVIASTEDGKQVPFGVLQEIHEAYICFLKRCEEYFLCHYLPPPEINSVGEHINLEATIYLEKLPSSEEKKIRRLLFDCLLKRETCISGCDSMNDIDLLELGSYTELQGGNIVLESGYSSLLDVMTKNIPKEKILLGQPVNKVIWSNSSSPGEDHGDESEDSDKTVIEDISKSTATDNSLPEGSHDKNENKSRRKAFLVEVVCENGDIHRAKHVICTIPLGVLKSTAADLFIPNLPQYKMEAISRLNFGTVNKIYLEYERPFLNPDITEIMLLWDNTSDDNDMTKSWFKKIYSFAKVSETLLLGWISGKEAEYMETLSMDVVASTCTKILRKFLNDTFVPVPEKCVCTSWKNQPYTKGSYTSIGVGASQNDIESLAQPLFKSFNDDKPILLFGGEHTHNSFYSTVHGAYISGITAADRLITSQENFSQTNNCPDIQSWMQNMHFGDS